MASTNTVWMSLAVFATYDVPPVARAICSSDSVSASSEIPMVSTSTGRAGSSRRFSCDSNCRRVMLLGSSFWPWVRMMTLFE